VVSLQILGGKWAGRVCEARRFPFRIGRSPPSDLLLEEEGVWDRHLVLHLEPKQGFRLQAEPRCFVAVNGEQVQETRLANGDLISFGAVRMRFSLSPPGQRSLRLREILTWLSLALFGLGQVAIIYWLLE